MARSTCASTDAVPLAPVPTTLAGAAPGAPAPAAPAARPQIDIRTVVQQAATRLSLPLPTTHLGPEPSVNEWHMLAVGLPVWLWNDGPSSIDASLTQQGIPLTFVAHLDGLSIDTGDGTVLQCASGTPRPADSAPMDRSPDCGHVWTTHGDYTITSTARWTVTWSALGRQGSFPMSRATSRTVHVGQLASVVVR